MYSSIEESSRKDVIEKTYWPLFDLVEDGIPIGLESSAITLEIINGIDPSWISKLHYYIKNKKIELIGSGYSQIIGPLIPSDVNEWNQKLGIEYYKDKLDVRPKTALVNEMAYSAGMIEHYLNAEYESIIMEWNNPRSFNNSWKDEWLYYPQKALGINSLSIPVIWADSIAFQKFQRYAHGEYQLDEYIDYIKSHIGNSNRFFPLYSNDIEIFNYRPGRYKTELKDDGNEWERIFMLFNYLKKQSWCEIIFPNQVISEKEHKYSWNELRFETPRCPIPVKKQYKYNINRWALTGTNDLDVNTKCFKIFKNMMDNEEKNKEDWKEICYLWSSDFRTHITEHRYNKFKKRLYSNKYLSGNKTEIIKTHQSNNIKFDYEDKYISIKNDHYKLVLNKYKGLAIKELNIPEISSNFVLGTIDHGYYKDISLGADYFSGHAIIEKFGEHKITDLINAEIKFDNKSKISCGIINKNFSFSKSISFEDQKITFRKRIKSNNLKKEIIRPFHFTFNPMAWDIKSLYLAINNGGSSFEKFYLKGNKVSHDNIYSSLISSAQAFGNTEGLLIVGDKDKHIKFKALMYEASLIPCITFLELNGTYFFRLYYSIREVDETLKNVSSGIDINCNLSLSF